jgi:thiamine pyrophosphokinase
MPTRSDAEQPFVVLADGAALPTDLLVHVAAAIDAAPLTIAADGGLHHAHRAGREVDVLVGDLDSVDAAALARARASGTDVQVHPPDKDATDLALALDLVLARTADGPAATRSVVPVLIIGGHGGRSDHLVGNLLLMAAERHARLRISAWWGDETVHIVRDRVSLQDLRGASVSLLPLHGPASGVSTTGLHFPLTDATLEAGCSLGVSNRLAGPVATVTVRTGVLAVLQSRTATGTESGTDREGEP